MAANLRSGFIAPPAGTGLCRLGTIGRIVIAGLFCAIIPLLLAEIGVLFILTYVPGLTLWPPRVLGYL